MKLSLCVAAFVAASAIADRADADDPVVVEYVAPQECASTEAFHALLAAQIARTPNPDRTWRFAVRIVHADDAYVGRVKTETTTRELHAKTCDEVVSAIALVIAMAAPPEPPSPIPPPIAIAPPPPPPMMPPLPPIETLPPLPVTFVPRAADRRPPEEREVRDSSTTFRLGLGAQTFTTGSFSATGATVTASIEPRWGWYHLLFELGYGLQFMPVSNGISTTLGLGSAAFTITWSMIDFESCPIGVGLGENITVFACNSLTLGLAAYPSGVESTTGALFFGGTGRIRWQSPWKIFAEAHVGGIMSTQSGEWSQTNGWWLDAGAQIGLAL